ncbi:hypothetical protein J1N35_036370 [Gossypium stocksii]|uniref:Uncharacterized protein n=1 Tax=Gossypium stocksii TaxID=47602 RepID=A0A9D3ZJW4_9ROSI|nr:hypothetical protein J1N35_036370 [Gossypium stocksii]
MGCSIPFRNGSEGLAFYSKIGRKTKGPNPVWPNSNTGDGSSTARTSQVNGVHSGAIRALTVARHPAVEGAIRALIVARLEQ